MRLLALAKDGETSDVNHYEGDGCGLNLETPALSAMHFIDDRFR